MEVLFIENIFISLDSSKLELINGGFTKTDALGVYGSLAFIGGVMVTCINPGLGLTLIGSGFAAWDSM